MNSKNATFFPSWTSFMDHIYNIYGNKVVLTNLYKGESVQF